MFELHYTTLLQSEKQTWEIAVIPWDTETFGLGVASLRGSFENYQSEDALLLEKALERYSENEEIRLVITTIPIGEKATSFFLQRAGFRLIDLSLSISYPNLNHLPEKVPKGISLKPAVSEEIEDLITMAGISFHHGRYHMDPFISEYLANQRYKDWLRRSSDPGNQQQLLTVKYNNTICGFSVVECRESEGYMHLHAIEAKWQGKKLGSGMIIESLRYLRDAGAERAGTKISASNLKALKMHAQLNGQFTAAERLLHWHRCEK